VLQPERHQEQFEAYHRMEKREGNTKGRVIVIGLNQHHDWSALHEIGEWMDANGDYEIFSAIAIDHLDHYDMTTRPNKGDAVAAIRKHRDVFCVIALHLFGLAADGSTNSLVGGNPYYYTQENHKLLNLCMERKIPLVVWGDQPFRSIEKLPQGIERQQVGTNVMYMSKRDDGSIGRAYPIYMYDKN
jgi:hypothetical protein